MPGKKPPKPTDISAEERELFRRTVGKVTPVTHARVVHRHPAPRRKSQHPPAPPPAQGLDVDIQLAPEDEVFFHRGGIPQKQLRKFKRGEVTIEDRLDLHGRTAAEALSALEECFAQADTQAIRCVLIIHGKGYRSQQSQPILKNLVCQWLQQQPRVLAFCSARPADGGTGAVYVLIQRRPLSI